MKKKMFIALLMIVQLTFAQSSMTNNEDYIISYQINYKRFVNTDKITSENSVLIVKNNNDSFFTLKTMIVLDSIQRVRSLDEADVMIYKSPLYYFIKRNENKISHFELLGSELFEFKESVVFDWELINEEKEISGYKCKKALANYGDREWIAWYTSEIPISEGPYKFYGLPGLILEISDTENIFHFSIYEIKKGNIGINTEINNYFIKDGVGLIQEIEKDDFYIMRYKFNQMSIEDRFKYMNRKEEAVPELKITSVDGGESIKTNRKPKEKNFIERYSKK